LFYKISRINAHWDTIKHKDHLKEVINRIHDAGIRVSLFVNAVEQMVEGAMETGADRIEFYTGDFAKNFIADPNTAVEAHTECAKLANRIGIGINAGHDLNLENLNFYAKNMPGLLEVSIGQSLISDALYYGLQNTIQMYRRCLVV
jgi:pyridoxine 5-phosphate synthase